MPFPQQVVGTGLTGATAAGSAMATAPAPYDSQLFAAPGAGLQATVTFPATAGKRWVIRTATWSIYNETGAAQAPGGGGSGARIVDVGGGVLFYIRMGPPAVGGGTIILSKDNIAYIGGIGNAVTVEFQFALYPGNFQSVNAGANLI